MNWFEIIIHSNISLTMSTVTSPTLVAPCVFRKLLTRSCSLGIFAAKMALRSVDASLNCRKINDSCEQTLCK